MLQSKKGLFAALLVAAIGLGLAAVRLAQSPQKKTASERFITANPFDLAQIRGFSKYRSCEGHDYRGPNLAGKMETTPRSMKHYVSVKREFRGTTDRVNVFAPFDGEISVVKNETSAGSQVWLTPDPRRPSRWQFIFFHLILDQGLQKGVSVTAGQRLGAADLADGPDGATDNVDIALKFARPFSKPAIDTPFKHMTEKVLAEYKKYGASAGDFIISKEDRDAHPCPVSPDGGGADAAFLPGAADNDYVWLKPPALE